MRRTPNPHECHAVLKGSLTIVGVNAFLMTVLAQILR